MKSNTSPQLDIFAEHLANGLSPRKAAHAMGLSDSSGDKMLQRLRARLGPQAR